MADDNPPTNEEQEPVEQDAPATDAPDSLGDAGIKALKSEREARREAEQRAKELQQRLQEIEDAEKSELQKAQERLAEAEKAAADASAEATRLRVATEKGLSPAQAKRLAGSTYEEMAADADELLEQFAPAAPAPPGGRPKPLVSGTGDGNEPPPNPAEIADRIWARKHPA